MSSTNALDELAWDYLTTPELYRANLRERVIEMGATIVFPLLRATLKHFEEIRKNEFKQSLHIAKTLPEGDILAYSHFINTIGASYVEDVAETITSIGQVAWDSVCRGLWEKNRAIQLLATLLLTEDKNPSKRTAQNVIAALNNMETTEKYFAESGIGFLLLLVVARTGDQQFEELVSDTRDEQGQVLTREEYLERSRNTVWLYFLQHGFSK